MSLTLTTAELTERFPEFRVAVLLFRGLTIAEARSPSLDADILGREQACRLAHAGMDLSAIAGVAAWRTAYKGFGIKKTSYRSSVERLIKRVLAGERLPAINRFVDAYNAVSLAHGFCVGADDLEQIAPPLAFRFSRQGDSFLDMAAAPGEDPEDPPKPGEVVLADSRHVLCRRWNWRQDMRSAISPGTHSALVTIQANGWGDLDAAVADLCELVGTQCGGSVAISRADAGTPTITLG
jgi:DNA/RNA-binding domain of Phe-tRNA-synthetase-like protein